MRKRRLPSPTWVSIIQFTKGQKRTKIWRKGEFSVLELGHLPAPALGHCCFWFLGLHIQILDLHQRPPHLLRPWTGSYTTGSLDSQAYRVELNYTTGFLGFPACTWHTVSYLSSSIV